MCFISLVFVRMVNCYGNLPIGGHPHRALDTGDVGGDGHPTSTIDHMSENQWNKAHLARLWSCLSASHARFDPFWHSWWSASGTWPHPPPLRTAYTLTQRGGGGRHPISTIDHMSKNYWNKAQLAHLWLCMSAPHERFDPIWPWGWSIIDTVAVPCITPI